MNKGFVVAGNMLVDITKLISAFPVQHGLVNILDKSYSLGGLVCNVTGSLARLDPSLPIKALSLIGQDAEADFLLTELKKLPNVDTSLIQQIGSTSFTDVLTEFDTRARTFLFYSGADGKFDIEHVPLDHLDCDIFHAGYILLLPALDAQDADYGTRMARLLHDVKARGILTSLDIVSEVGDRYTRLVPPALRYTDFLIINEIEAGKTTGIDLRDNQNRLIRELIPEVLKRLKQMGVSRWAVIHAPEGGFGLDENHRYVELPSLKLPEGFIKGTVGAGDAFCAGTLYAAYKRESIETGLIYGIAAAALSLSERGGADGVKSIQEALDLYHAMPKQTLS